MSQNALQQAEKPELLDLPQIAQEIKAHLTMMTGSIVHIGQRLIQVKESLDHGQFTAWLAESVGFSHSTANNFMHIAREAPQTPGILSLPHTKVLALLSVPADQREAFAAENDVENLSVDEVRRLTQQLKASESKVQAAEKEAQEARFAAGRAQEMAAQYNDLYHGQVQAAEEARIKLEKALASPATVEVPPPDYDTLRRAAEEAETTVLQEREKAQRLVQEAEDYAEQAEEKLRAAQAEARRLRESGEGAQASGSPLDAGEFAKSVREFMAGYGSLPHMASFFQQMNREEIDQYKQWLDVVGEWLHGTRQAIQDGADRFVSTVEAVVK